jgi:membrane protein
VDPVAEKQSEETQASGTRAGRMRAQAAALRERVERLERRAQAERGRHESVDAVFAMADRDMELGGGIIAGALAYRLFIWLLPLALVAVAGLGIAAEARSETPQDAAESLGMAGLVSNSIANAAKGSSRWYALAIGIPVLIYTTRGVLRVLIGSHRILWGDLRSAAPKPTLVASLRLLVLLLSFPVASVVASTVRAWSPGVGLLASLVATLPYAGLWLLISIRLPHRAAAWTDLIPGALLFGFGIEVIQLVAAYFLAPYAIAKQGTYGALGVAAALLFALYLASRLAVSAAVLNATLWERRTRPT